RRAGRPAAAHRPAVAVTVAPAVAVAVAAHRPAVAVTVAPAVAVAVAVAVGSRAGRRRAPRSPAGRPERRAQDGRAGAWGRSAPPRTRTAGRRPPSRPERTGQAPAAPPRRSPSPHPRSPPSWRPSAGPAVPRNPSNCGPTRRDSLEIDRGRRCHSSRRNKTTPRPPWRPCIPGKFGCRTRSTIRCGKAYRTDPGEPMTLHGRCSPPTLRWCQTRARVSTRAPAGRAPPNRPPRMWPPPGSRR
ncbi:MAG: hypothetical protein QOJ69_1351, partial [Actinomycetota bacterium]|nr:hypothetical protein [Actinomycetota bacterium]